MPNAPRKLRVPGVRTRAERDKDYDQRRQRDPKLAWAKRIRDSAPWKRFVQRHRAQHPLCVDPFGFHAKEGVSVPAESRHHVKPLQQCTYDEAFDPANVVGLCWVCHNKVERMERNGQATAHLFGGSE